MLGLRAAAVATVLLLVAPFAMAASPDPATHWFTRINVTHKEPEGMTVVVVPAVYFSESAMVDDVSWLGPDALLTEPGTRAALEATTYWAWMLDASEAAYPALAHLTYTTKVLGVDATVADLAEANIVINTGMVADPAAFVFHAGLGLPTTPLQAFLFDSGGQDVCTVWNTGVGQEGDSEEVDAAKRAFNDAGLPVRFRLSEERDVSPTRLRNLILHEFGHCLGAGHMGESLGFEHSNAEGVVYEDHPTDVLSVAVGDHRQCLSNANMLSLAEGYAWTLSGTTWMPHDAEAYMLKSAYAQTCLPATLQTY